MKSTTAISCSSAIRASVNNCCGVFVISTDLDLSDNDLHRDTGEQLAQAFATTPSSVYHIDLSKNYLRFKKGAELKIAFIGLPAHVTHLSLRHNFNSYAGAELAIALSGIPSRTTFVDLGENGFGIEIPGIRCAIHHGDAFEGQME